MSDKKAQIIADIADFWNLSDERKRQTGEIVYDIADDGTVTIIQDSNNAMHDFLNRLKTRYTDKSFITVIRTGGDDT